MKLDVKIGNMVEIINSINSVYIVLPNEGKKTSSKYVTIMQIATQRKFHDYNLNVLSDSKTWRIVS